MESLLSQLGRLEQSAPDLHAALADHIRENLVKARSNQPVERKLDRHRCLTNKISHRRKQADKWEAWLQGMQKQMDEARGKLTALEAELRGYEQERKELLQECQEEEASQVTGMEDDGDDEEDLEEARHRRDVAVKEWQEVVSRKLLRATAKTKSRRSGPYQEHEGYDDL